MDNYNLFDLLKNKRHPLFACRGCPDAASYMDAGFMWVHVKCRRFARPLATHSIRAFGICPFNQPVVESKKDKVRVGQQKSKRIGG